MQVSQDGFYTLVLVFEAKALKLPEFETRQVQIDERKRRLNLTFSSVKYRRRLDRN